MPKEIIKPCVLLKEYKTHLKACIIQNDKEGIDEYKRLIEAHEKGCLMCVREDES